MAARIISTKHCGQLLFAPGGRTDTLMETALDSGAEDVITNDDGSLEVITARMIMLKLKCSEAKVLSARIKQLP